MLTLTDRNFKTEVLDSDLPVLVDFCGEWCPPCQMAAPVLEELAKEYESKVKFGKLDVDQNPQTPAKYEILSIPTVIVFKNGKEAGRQIGFQGKSSYEELIEEVINV